MKIDEMSEIQDVLRCSKDEAYRKQLKDKKSELAAAQKALRTKIHSLQIEVDALRRDSKKISKTLKAAEGLVRVGSIPVIFTKKGNYYFINRLGKKDDELHDVVMSERRKIMSSGKEISSICFSGGYITTWNDNINSLVTLPSIGVLKEWGCQYAAGELTADEFEAKVRAASSIHKGSTDEK